MCRGSDDAIIVITTAAACKAYHAVVHGSGDGSSVLGCDVEDEGDATGQQDQGDEGFINGHDMSTRPGAAPPHPATADRSTPHRSTMYRPNRCTAPHTLTKARTNDYRIESWTNLCNALSLSIQVFGAPPAGRRTRRFRLVQSIMSLMHRSIRSFSL